MGVKDRHTFVSQVRDDDDVTIAMTGQLIDGDNIYDGAMDRHFPPCCFLEEPGAF
ncbi:hypothetical protein GCM10011418_11240 [Sphingobacterium alkalisoli]|nr:hypothetical protein GCM10011418_11240 [Sphingobacterium alkalisoli]